MTNLAAQDQARHIASNLAEWVRLRQVSDRALADALGMSARDLRNCLSGDVDFTVGQVAAAARFLAYLAQVLGDFRRVML